jgi:hypothetical protein
MLLCSDHSVIASYFDVSPAEKEKRKLLIEKHGRFTLALEKINLLLFEVDLAKAVRTHQEGKLSFLRWIHLFYHESILYADTPTGNKIGLCNGEEEEEEEEDDSSYSDSSSVPHIPIPPPSPPPLNKRGRASEEEVNPVKLKSQRRNKCLKAGSTLFSTLSSIAERSVVCPTYSLH